MSKYRCDYGGQSVTGLDRAIAEEEKEALALRRILRERRAIEELV